jgi:hypothetical protein
MNEAFRKEVTMAAPRYQKQLTFSEQDWKLLHEVCEIIGTNSSAYIREATMEAARNFMKQRYMTEEKDD